jgi:hypothetical protein
METTYIGAADTAKLIRKALKRHFPGVKFSVKSKTYSGGASIDVDWIDGPTRRQVEAVTGNYRGGRFDGMIDMAYSVTHYLLPDGSAVVAQSPGSVGSGGLDPAFEREAPHPDAKAVHFKADHVFCNRRHSAGLVTRALAAVARKWGGFDPADLEVVGRADGSAWCDGAGSVMVANAGRWLDSLLTEELARRTNYVPRAAA